MKLKSGLLQVAMMAGIMAAAPETFTGEPITRSPNGNQAGDRQITSTASTSELRVLFCDQAHVAAKTLEDAQRIASQVFHEARMNLVWLDGMEHSVTEADCVLRIQRCYTKVKSKLPDRTVAFAPAGGRHVSIFWDRLAEEAAAGNHSEALLLGYVIAHELGHLLLPPSYHSAYGIMQGRMHYDDLSEARRLGNLFFSEEESARMRAALGGFLESNLMSKVAVNR